MQIPAQPDSSNTPPPDLRELLASIGENLTAQAQAGGRADIYEREAEIQQALQAMASPVRGKVIVLGPRRVGKTAVVEAVVARLARGQCPPELDGREVWRLTPASLYGLTGQGHWYPVLDQILNLWPQRPEIILFFDEITQAARAGGGDDENRGPDMAQILAAGLKRAPGICLAEAEENTWRRFAENYSDYGHLFLPLRLAETDPAATRGVLQRVAQDLGILHGLAVADDAIDQAIDLSQRYGLDSVQPGKSIDLLRDSLAVADAGAGALSGEAVVRRFGDQSGLPPMLLSDDAPFNEADVLRYFRQRVLGQDQAVEAIVQALSLLRARLHNPLRPMGVFLFLGPTGVGKTELARTLAEYLYGHRDRLVRFNMGDYAYGHQYTELFGDPYARDAAYRRGQLTNRLAGRAFSVIVLDEFEKAHPVIYQRCLQLFDEGLLINGNDETVNLRNAIFIITSNFGARLIEQDQIGFSVRETMEARERRVLSETEEHFTPEFINRIDAVCIFHPLNRAVMAEIARREIGDLLRRDGLTRRQLEIEIGDEVIDHVVSLGYSPHYGARYLKRQIEKTITYPLAREINALPGRAAGGSLRLYARHGRVQSAYLPPVSLAPQAAPAAEAAAPDQPTLEEIRLSLPVLAARVEALEAAHRLTDALAEREAVLAEMADVAFWADPSAAQRKLDTYQRASSTVDVLGTLRQALDSLAEHSGETPDLEAALRAHKFLHGELPRLEYASWLSGPHDTCGAYLRIGARSRQAGARQWVATLARMYLGWAAGRGLATSILGEETSPEGRAFQVTIVISGFGAYGLLRGESGAHRLVQMVKVGGRETLQRMSATVQALPELDDDDLPPSSQAPEVSLKQVARSGLLIPRLTAQVAVRLPGGGQRLSLAGDLPAEDLASEATRILRTSAFLEEAEPAGNLVRSYARNTREKGVHDHRTGLRSLKVKQVLEGQIQDFLDAALRQPRS